MPTLTPVPSGFLKHIDAGGPIINIRPARTAKYIFLFIGDGMGQGQRRLAAACLRYLRATADPKFRHLDHLLMESLPAQGWISTFDASSPVPDSASAATSLACGIKTACGVIGLDKSGARATSLAEQAKASGLKVGIVSSASIDHATPAAFYAHQPARSSYYEIGQELVSSGFDYFGGGGMLMPESPNGCSPNLYDAARTAGYTIVSNAADFAALRKGCGKVLVVNPVLARDQSLPFEIDRLANDLTLADYTRKGIELLANPHGFLLVVEGGKIDWACHTNDISTSVADVLALDRAIAEAYQFYMRHSDETLIVVTADHETGGLSPYLPPSRQAFLANKIVHQQRSYMELGKCLDLYKETHPRGQIRFEHISSLLEETFGFAFGSSSESGLLVGQGNRMIPTKEELLNAQRAFYDAIEPKGQRSSLPSYVLYGAHSKLIVDLAKAANDRLGIRWSTVYHTSSNVPISAIGVGEELFSDTFDNTQVPSKILAAAGILDSRVREKLESCRVITG